MRSEVPCGSCVGCKISRAREWATRCVHEASFWKSSGFVTLTYSDDQLPDNASLDQEELQRFFKRLRRARGGRPFKYYACGEYGEKKGRPHYHAIIFGIEPCHCPLSVQAIENCGCEDRQLVIEAWAHGGVDRIGTVNYHSARYTADYIGKTVWKEDQNLPRQRPFHLISLGIGRRFVDKNASQLRETMGVTIGGVPVGLPRYYIQRMRREVRLLEDLWFVPYLWDRDTSDQAISKKRHHWVGKLRPHIIALEVPRLQREADLNARLHLYGKDGPQ